MPERSSEHAPGSARSGGLSSARHAASCADSGPATAKFLRLTLRRDPIHHALGSAFFCDNVLVEASEAAIYNVLPGQMRYSSALLGQESVTRVNCRVEGVVYLVPLMDAERSALTCV